ncbi:MAG: hypothetical protein C3F12_05680 [Candidatus Methylomirabilota bacterium]|nr:nucleotidyltransferase domain-containing protein [Candidatus Methylomirabilis sp.]PWB47457.1 MAG: hypothetical protein C3F12_05680 [candidate division NC10 bacterium]
MDQVVKEYVAELRKRLGSSMRQVLLFDSRARGSAREDSDYDMLVVVEQRTPKVRGHHPAIPERCHDLDRGAG